MLMPGVFTREINYIHRITALDGWSTWKWLKNIFLYTAIHSTIVRDYFCMPLYYWYIIYKSIHNIMEATDLVLYIYLIQNSPAVKKSMAPRRPLWKKMWNPKWQPRNGCDGRLIAKFLITMIHCCLLHVSLGYGTRFTWIVINNFAISLSSQLFLGCHLGFSIFFTMALLGPHPLFAAGLFWIRFHFFM